MLEMICHLISFASSELLRLLANNYTCRSQIGFVMKHTLDPGQSVFFLIPGNVVFHFSVFIVEFVNFNHFYFSFSVYNADLIAYYWPLYTIKYDVEQSQYRIHKTLCKTKVKPIL